MIVKISFYYSNSLVVYEDGVLCFN